MNPRQPLLRTQRAPFPPDRSAGAVNAYSPKPTHQVGFAPRAPVGFAPRAPVGFAPRAPVGFAPHAPVGFAPRAPVGFAPRAPVGFAPHAPVGFALARLSAPRSRAPVGSAFPRVCRLRVPARPSASRPARLSAPRSRAPVGFAPARPSAPRSRAPVGFAFPRARRLRAPRACRPCAADFAPCVCHPCIPRACRGNLRRHRTNEVVGRRMDFSSDANANFEGLLEVNRGIFMPQMAEKTSPDAPPSCAVSP